MGFDVEYEKFIGSHVKQRNGVRLERLKHGHGRAEKEFLERVWWPAFQHFTDLHPEYEVHDFHEGYRYIDFAYIKPNYRIAIEIDGLGPHWRNISKWKFSDHNQRQNHLVIDGWHVLRFTYHDVEENPRLCQKDVQQLVGRLLGSASAAINTLTVMDREIIRLAMRSTRPITPTQVATLLKLSDRSAIRHLRHLTEIDWLVPASGSIRIRCYTLHPSRESIQW